MLNDRRDLETSAPTRAALDGLEHAAHLMLQFRADPLATVDAVLAEHPQFAGAHAFRAALLVTSSEPGALPAIGDAITAIGAAADATERDRAYAAAAQAWCEGRFDTARARFVAIVRQWPRDLSALQFAHQLSFLTGEREELRALPDFVLHEWRGAKLPGEGFAHGMHAFGLEENGCYREAEQAGLRAVEAEHGDAWAIHAVAHVMEMQGRVEEGVRWLGTRTADWAPENMLAYHNWWHLALYRLERNDTPGALELYDTAIRTPGSVAAMELVDASAMLWRLTLRGVDVGARWAELADAWVQHAAGFYAFNDVHAVMAFACARREEQLETWLEAMQAALSGPGTNAEATARAGLKLARGIAAFADGDYRMAVVWLINVAEHARRMGGSNAQRDIVELTLLEAALRSGDRRLAGRLATRRSDAKPESPFARMLAIRAAGIAHAA